jgi:hypothetical protein
MMEKFCPAKQLLAFQEGLLHRVIAITSSTHRLIGYSTVTGLDYIVHYDAMVIYPNRLSADLAVQI